ncbi:DNA primase [Prochlorococcus marinus]|uniref:DNA primase n=1 Tax=Prochlorococcus marinus XMU1408 TaxID=2213228 RepID=A0A318R697_PROMR|nr:DNA primase [Prochlorococcus marinus]MBW3041900.1 DNA primase [Prochlorococcus marinus str. XMU1408]PYE03031.1 DNA primase [Prochlorococcus marinus XMU1408]
MASVRLHPRTIESVKDRVDIVDVVGDHVVLKKKGKEFVGICPFHDDSKPSMSVIPGKQFYYCFSCGAGGNAIKFLMEFERKSFSDVVLELAKKYQVPVDTVEGPQQERLKQQISRRDTLYRVLKLATGWFRNQLNSSCGENALNYLQNSRNLSDGALINFEIGYAPDNWDSLLNYFVDIEKVSVEILESSGLIVPKKGGNGFYDRFRNRIIVPIHDRQKRVIGFGGRSLDGSEPKYLNSPETEIFEKGKNLFGLDKAALSIRKKDYAVVVEGYFDVIALHDSGITNVVASLGTALSRNQITLLSRSTDSKKILLNFDSDSAGIRAANRAINEVENLAIQGQLDLRVLQLPSGKDPDEFLRDNSSSEYEALAAKSPLWMDWQIDQSLKDLDLSKSDQFQIAVSDLVSLLGKLPQTAIRTHYLQKVAQRLSGGQGRFALQLEEDLRNQIRGQRWHGRSKKYEKDQEISHRERSEADILFIYIHCPNSRSFIRNELRLRDLDDFAINHHRVIWSTISNIEEKRFGFDKVENINRGSDTTNVLAEVDLIKHLLDTFLVSNNEHLSKLTLLLEADELRQATLSEPEMQIRGSLAVLEKQKSLKRCRHLIDAWSSQRLQTLENCIASLIVQENSEPSNSSDMEERVIKMFEELNNDAINFQDLYYAERKHILHLDQQRCFK